MAGDATAAQIAAFGVALRSKGETAAEITGLADAMLGHARRVPVDDRRGRRRRHRRRPRRTPSTSRRWRRSSSPRPGVRVVKHGNRAASSSQRRRRRARGARRRASTCRPEAVAACVAEVGIGFCFAPVYPPVDAARRGAAPELGIPTAFNVLGPLTNPAQPRAGLDRLRRRPAGAGDRGGVRRSAANSALVVRGDDGLDELTTTDHVARCGVVPGGEVRVVTLDPDRSRHRPAYRCDDLRGGDAEKQRRRARAVLAGEHRAGARRGPAQRGAARSRRSGGSATSLRRGIRGGLEPRLPRSTPARRRRSRSARGPR